MNEQKFTKIKGIVVTLIGAIIAVSVLRGTYLFAIVAVSLGLLVLVLARTQLNVVVTDERNAVIQQKASTITLCVFSVLASISGLVMIEISYRGYEYLRGYGFFLTYLVMGVVSLNAILRWHYGRQLGD